MAKIKKVEYQKTAEGLLALKITAGSDSATFLVPVVYTEDVSYLSEATPAVDAIGRPLNQQVRCLVAPKLSGLAKMALINGQSGVVVHEFEEYDVRTATIFIQK